MSEQPGAIPMEDVMRFQMAVSETIDYNTRYLLGMKGILENFEKDDELTEDETNVITQLKIDIVDAEKNLEQVVILLGECIKTRCLTENVDKLELELKKLNVRVSGISSSSATLTRLVDKLQKQQQQKQEKQEQ